jgi:hypothetical protein
MTANPDNDFDIRPAAFDDLGDVAAIHVKVWQSTYVGQIPQSYLDGLDIKTRVCTQ